MDGLTEMTNQDLTDRRRGIQDQHPRDWSSQDRSELFSLSMEIERRLAAVGDPRYQQCETCASLPRQPGSRWCQPCIAGTRWK
jgi:hypothetical protein